MIELKGESLDNWNWQTKEKKLGEDSLPRRSLIKQLKSLDEDKENALEKAFI